MKMSSKALLKPLISEPVEGPNAWLAPSPAHNHDGSVMVVEDNPDIRSLLSITFKAVNARLELISNGTELRERIDESVPPAVLVLDRMLPGVSGDLLLMQLRSNPIWQQTPVVMISALRRRTEVKSALLGGANHYMPKPLNLSALVKTVQVYLH